MIEIIGDYTRTNADEIRQMSDDELEDFITNVIVTGYDDCFRYNGSIIYLDEISDWLQRPSE